MVYYKCEDCYEPFTTRDLEKNNWICPKCGGLIVDIEELENEE